MPPFEKGHIPWNKGKHGGYSKETILKMSNSHKGKLSPKARELGSEMEDNGYIRVKISNHPNCHTRWRLKHHIIYEKYHPNIKIGKTYVNQSKNYRSTHERSITGICYCRLCRFRFTCLCR